LLLPRRLGDSPAHAFLDVTYGLSCRQLVRQFWSERISNLWQSITAGFLSLPVHPVIDPSARCRTRPLSRSAKLDHSDVVVGGFVGKVDEQRPLIPGQASANDVLNALVVHGAVSSGHLACEDPQCAREMAHLGGMLLNQPADQRLRSPARISHQPCAQGSLQNLGSMGTPRERHCLYRLGAFVAARGRRPSIGLFGSGIAPRPERDDLTSSA
jgi:hypothetical protein